MIKNKILSGENFADVFPLFDSNTLMHSDELQTKRLTNEKLLDKTFWTADALLFREENNTVALYIGRGNYNPIFKHVAQASKALGKDICQEPYFPNKRDVNSLINASSTLRVEYRNLNIISEADFDDELGFYDPTHIAISTKQKNILTRDEQNLVERLYGRNYTKVLSMLNKHELEKTLIYLPSIDYFRNKIPKGDALSRVGILLPTYYHGGFDAGSNFADFNGSQNDWSGTGELCMIGKPIKFTK